MVEEERRTRQDMAEILEIAAQRRDNESVIEIEEKTAQMLIVLLDGGYYGFYGRWIREIMPVATITYVPGMPDYLLGVINVRGEIESVIDLRTMLGLPFRPPEKQSRIAIAQARHIRSGILVDSVEDVLDIPEDRISRANEMPNFPRHEYVLGETQYRDQPVILLDIEKILTLLLNE